MRRFAVLVPALLACLALPLVSQPPVNLGGTYKQLLPEQRNLVQRWAAEYQSIVGKPVDVESAYNELPLSSRTTFEAVTHALSRSKLTDESGKSLGTAIDLVDVVERIAGRVPGTRGDSQFRVYVYLKPDAVDKLYAAREFKRDHDNTVYHIGYPINFRQGGTPSVQFSIARTGNRADIDVDYRSSAIYKAVFDGHLTAANSDVRAGGNYARHTERWSGFKNWWQSLIAELFGGDSAKADQSFGGSDAPIVPPVLSAWEVASKKTVEEAAHAFLKEWLEIGDPANVLRGISVKAYPCVADFQDGARPDSKLALVRMLREMQAVNQRLGKISNLSDAVEPISYPLPDATAINQPYSDLFKLQLVPDDVAWALDCRIRYRMAMTEAVPPPPHKTDSGVYAASFRLKSSVPNSFLLVFFQKQGGEWKVVSFDLKRDMQDTTANLVERAKSYMGATASDVPDAPTDAVDEISQTAVQTLTAWLVNRKPEEALGSFSSDSYACDAFARGSVPDSQRSGAAGRARLLGSLTDIANTIEERTTLTLLIDPPEAGHQHLRPIDHPNADAFLLARVSDDLAAVYACSPTGVAPRLLKKHASGTPTYARGVYLTAFRSMAVRDESPAVVMLFWEKRDGRWQIISYDLADD